MEPDLYSKIQTPSVLVAADLASQSKRCTFCAKIMEGVTAPHLCTSCGKPQPVSGDYFAAFGVPRKFAQDRQALEKRFYELSRILHPDRFSDSAVQDAKRLSLERMSFINQAYNTLKRPEILREYLLALEEVLLDGLTEQKAQIPLDLAESWFELQDAISEGENDLAEKIRLFEVEVQQKIQESATKILKLEASYDALYDATPARVTLLQIAKVIQTQSYLSSLQRDVQKIKSRIA